MREKFQLLVHESEGQKYEDLFVKIMRNVDPHFKPVKPHGNIGDRGNDGYCSNNGKYYQVYAPENIANNTETALAKMRDDFGKLKSYWDSIAPVKEYYFVVNDKYKGVSPHISKYINEIKILHNLRNADILLSHQLESMLFAINSDLITSIIGTASSDNQSIHKHLVDQITEKMYLKYWVPISDNLIANAIEFDVIEGFSDATMMIFKTIMPGTIPSLEASIIELANRVQTLIDHFTRSPYAYCSEDMKWWRMDMRWKREWIKDQKKYHEKYALYDNWREELYKIHYDLVHALNLFAVEVRTHIYPQYFMGQQFTLVDSLGAYNSSSPMEGYEAIPHDFIRK